MSEPVADDHSVAVERTNPTDAVDAAMANWRQGDVAVYDRFLHLANAAHPVTSASVQAAERGGEGELRILSKVDGLVVLTQTCDIRRRSEERPYIELAPLIRNRPDLARAAWLFERPRYAAVPGLGDDAVADLDRTMTVEKGFLATLDRVPGWTSDEQIQRFAAAAGRRYSRFAFPDELVRSLDKLLRKIKSTHGKLESPEGRLLDKVRQIRVHATPNWSSDAISAELTFILAPGVLPQIPDDDVEAPRHHVKWLESKSRLSTEIASRIADEKDPIGVEWLWNRLADAWAAMCSPAAPIAEVSAEVIGADEYTIDRYWASQQLDLDHLSVGG